MRIFKTAIIFIFFTLICTGNIFPQIISSNDALTAAFHFSRQLNNNLKSGSDLRLEYTAYTSQNEPAWYVFEYPETGFIIISAEKQAHPVIGYSFDAPFSGNSTKFPQSFDFWMDQRIFEIEEIRNHQYPASTETEMLWMQLTEGTYSGNDLKTRDVQPLLKSAWNQDCQYNEMCPADAAGPCGKVYAGCVATTMGQIMYYWRFPFTGNGSLSYNASPYGTQSVNFGSTTYKWDEMKGSINTSHTELAKLLYHAAVSVYMNFSPSGSGADSYDVPSALKNKFRYSSANYRSRSTYTSSSWNALIKGNIDNKYPVYYSGSGNGGGHAFVCDGYQGTDYFHFDWGWSGYYNGYFYLNNLNPGTSTFNSWQAAVVDIYPPAASYPQYCNGQKTLTAVSGSFDDGSGPIASYQANTNCSWLIKPSDPVDWIKLNFVYLDTESANDVITIYDGETTSANVLGTFSGSTLPGFIQSTGEAMLVTFTSNGSIHQNGFLAEYYALPSKFCSGTISLTDASGIIEDGSGEDYQYLNSANCRWIIEPSFATSVSIVFTELDTETSTDKVKIMDLDNGIIVGEYSGNTLPAPFTVHASKVLVHFISNTSVQGNGWALSYSVTTDIHDETINTFSVYPNPATDEIQIRLPVISQSLLSVFDVSGRLCIRQEIYPAGDIFTLDISELQSGVYILELTTENKSYRSKLTAY